MPRTTLGRALAATTVAACALAFAPAVAQTTTDAASVLTAADVGLDFAPRLVHVDAPTRAERNAVVELGLDVTEHASNDHVEVLLHSAEDLGALRAAGFDFDVVIDDLVRHESERIAADEAFSAAVGQSDLPSGRTTYRRLPDFATEIDQLVADHPEIAKRISIGTSLEGRDLTGIEIGRDVQAPEDGRPVFLMFGVHHAREWPSAEMPMEFAIDLVTNYGTDQRITDLLDRSRVIIVPVSNPDGYNASRESSEMFGELPDDPDVTGGVLGAPNAYLTPTNAYKRKNCRYVDGQSQPAGTCDYVFSPLGSGLGVDLNRNYGALWGGPGASDDPTSATYHGAAPFSEPETQAIRSLISTRQVTTLITNHTQGHLILRPVGVQPSTFTPDGYTAGFSPDECFTLPDGTDGGMQALGERMAAQNGYSNQFGWELYDTTGTTEDYSYNATGGYGYTFELMNGAFHPAYEQVVAEYNGTTDAAEAVTADNAADHTTEAGDDCAGDPVEHDTVGGGMREAYLIALENAVDTQTHSIISGTAPAGTQLTLARTGTFPIWDGTEVEDTVTTTMTVGSDGTFDWHVNPSTRPFVQSRKALALTAPIDEFSETNVAPPSLGAAPTETTFEVSEGVDLVRAKVEAAASASGLAVNFAEYHLTLVDPDGNDVAAATAFGPVNTLIWRGFDGEVPAGTYTLRVANQVNPTAAYTLSAQTYGITGETTPRQFESWALSCDGGEPTEVLVDRGESVDVGDLC